MNEICYSAKKLEINQFTFIKSSPEFNDEHYYSLNQLVDKYKRQPLYTPQINNISMHLPSMPVLYEWDHIPKVQKNTFDFIIWSSYLIKNSLCSS
jgi:hypothetical protein